MNHVVRVLLYYCRSMSKFSTKNKHCFLRDSLLALKMEFFRRFHHRMNITPVLCHSWFKTSLNYSIYSKLMTLNHSKAHKVNHDSPHYVFSGVHRAFFHTALPWIDPFWFCTCSHVVYMPQRTFEIFPSTIQLLNFYHCCVKVL